MSKSHHLLTFPNGNMTSKKLGSAKDEYLYDVQDNLVGYRGYDGYNQTYMYSALGMMYEKTSVGNAERVVLESVVADGAALSKNEESGDSDEDDHQQTTRYTYDALATFYQVLTETTGDSTTTYEYGIERIAAYTTATDAESVKTQYVYDVGGSVIQTLSSKYAEDIANLTATPNVVSYSYTPYGEQLGTDAISGYTYNAEYYDAATGMLNLRARQYEPQMMRFAQKDLERGSVVEPISLNRYVYCQDNPLDYSDPSGLTIWGKIKSAAKSVGNAVKSTAKAAAASAVSSAAKVTAAVSKGVAKASTAVAKAANKVSSVAANVANSTSSPALKKLASAVSTGASKVNKAANNTASKASATSKAATKIANAADKAAKAHMADAATQAKKAFDKSKAIINNIDTKVQSALPINPNCAKSALGFSGTSTHSSLNLSVDSEDSQYDIPTEASDVDMPFTVSTYTLSATMGKIQTLFALPWGLLNITTGSYSSTTTVVDGDPAHPVGTYAAIRQNSDSNSATGEFGVYLDSFCGSTKLYHQTDGETFFQGGSQSVNVFGTTVSLSAKSESTVALDGRSIITLSATKDNVTNYVEIDANTYAATVALAAVTVGAVFLPKTVAQTIKYVFAPAI